MYKILKIRRDLSVYWSVNFCGDQLGLPHAPAMWASMTVVYPQIILLTASLLFTVSPYCPPNLPVVFGRDIADACIRFSSPLVHTQLPPIYGFPPGSHNPGSHPNHPPSHASSHGAALPNQGSAITFYPSGTLS
ncbi:hypothetical protein D9758_018975 [Tetrapyrgos nigripes]|uniref:Uncharacterized protein n=1 Tax=Tetrapyrgos nigripes TaxID=182062 RepID=A0A8H5F5L7_9AGAR|nr:hypothetical protein D9758_018975 [Tetrapyrgos nigripes]